MDQHDAASDNGFPTDNNSVGGGEHNSILPMSQNRDAFPRRPREITVYDNSVPIMEPSEAWEMLVAADAVKDMINVKQAFLCYTRSMPDLTIADVEEALREAKMNTYIIGMEQVVSDTMTVVDLRGKKGCKYVISFQCSPKPLRIKFAGGWPKTPAENIDRLADAGFVKDGGLPKCRNCDEVGHIAKNCPQERIEREKPQLICVNCSGVGHYLRDCPEPRQSQRKRDGEEGDDARPPREPMVCRNCFQEGHKASDCTNERVMKCRNCDAVGHAARECPEPRDWSRVQCRQCGQMGHTQVRCKNPPMDSGDGDGGFGGYGNGDAGAGAFESLSIANAGDTAVEEGDAGVGAAVGGDDSGGVDW